MALRSLARSVKQTAGVQHLLVDDARPRVVFRRSVAHTRHLGERALDIVRDWYRRQDPRRVRAAKWLALGAVLLVVADVVLGSPAPWRIRSLANMPVATTVLDRNDRPAFTIFDERRYEVSLGEISPNLVNAVIAVEDRRFRRHEGLDLWRIAGSAWANLRSTSIEQGGSTITQQLAKLSFLTPDRTFRRKLKEAYLAVMIELAYNKDEILEIYLNKVYFGDGYYGAEAASRGYFAKHAKDLSVEEAALLAGLIQRPSAYAPGRHPDRAAARRAVVLDQMAAANMIDRATADALAMKPLAVTNGFKHEQMGAYFKHALTQELVERFGWDRVARGGLRVYTTFDPTAQAAAETSLAQGLAAIEGRRGFRQPARGKAPAPATEGSPDYLQGALVALDPRTGEVRALVGGRNFAESQFDRATQAWRQSGSAFKPFVYATALEQGLSPATLITGLDRPIATPEGPWLPDDGHDTAEAMTIRAALRTSSNRAAAQLLQTVGVARAVEYAKQLGLDAPPVPSLVLGTGDVTLLSLTRAYAVFANGGLLTQPTMIRRVDDADGTPLLGASEQASTRVVSEQTAFQITAMLTDVVDRGTGWQARNVGFRLPAAGKTGTTNDYRDAWFVGYTPDLVAGVWIGFDRPRTIVPGGYAADLAVPIWGHFMRDATAGEKPKAFERPSGLVAVEVCQDSGLLPGAACSRVHKVGDNGEEREVSTIAVEYFRRGTEPTEFCPIHRDTWFGGVKTVAVDPSSFPMRSLVGPAARDNRERDRRQPRDEGEIAAATDQAGDHREASDDKTPARRRGFWSRIFGK